MNIKECYDKIRSMVPKNTYVAIHHGFLSHSAEIEIAYDVWIYTSVDGGYRNVDGRGVSVQEAFEKWELCFKAKELEALKRDRAMQELT